jgi:hypothetical protein
MMYGDVFFPNPWTTGGAAPVADTDRVADQSTWYMLAGVRGFIAGLLSHFLEGGSI